MDIADLRQPPSKLECHSEKFEHVCLDLSPFETRYVNINKNVGFMAVFGGNLVFGTFGILFMVLFFVISLSATSYLVVSFLQFKCNKVAKEAIVAVSFQCSLFQLIFSLQQDNVTHEDGTTATVSAKNFRDKVMMKA